MYEKDGVKKEFSLEDYPANDSSWTFVDSKTELVKKGYQPPVAAFNIYNGEGDDVTEEIIGNPGPVLLLVAPKLEEADDEQMDEINGVYDYALEHDIPFYCVTALRLRRSMPGATIPEPNILSGWRTKYC